MKVLCKHYGNNVTIDASEMCQFGTLWDQNKTMAVMVTEERRIQ